MIGNGVESRSGQIGLHYVVDFFRRVPEYRPGDCAQLAVENGAAILAIRETYRMGVEGLSFNSSVIAFFAIVVPIGISIMQAIDMRREAINRSHLSNLK